MHLAARRPWLVGGLTFIILTGCIAEGLWWLYGYETAPREALEVVLRTAGIECGGWFHR